MFFAVLALALSFAPTLPDVPDATEWQVWQEGVMERSIASDVVFSLRDGGSVLRLIQRNRICPADLGASCTYTARYAFLSARVDGKTVYAHRYIAIGPTGARVEGVVLASRRSGYLFYRFLNGTWVLDPEGVDTGAGAFTGMLYEETRKH